MKRCHFKSEHSTASVLCTTNEALEAIIDDSAEVMSVARAVTSHKGLVGKAIGVSGAPLSRELLGGGGRRGGNAGRSALLPCQPRHGCPSGSSARALQSKLGGS